MHSFFNLCCHSFIRSFTSSLQFSQVLLVFYSFVPSFLRSFVSSGHGSDFVLHKLLCPLFLHSFTIGARSDGVEGFFKGIGKGLLGLLSHPVGGVIDMVSFTLDGVKRQVLFYFC